MIMLIISVTPRDLSSFNPITDASLRGHVTHGYQGFPVNNFEKSRDRAIQDHLSETKNSPRNHYHGVSHYLDTSKIWSGAVLSILVLYAQLEPLVCISGYGH